MAALSVEIWSDVVCPWCYLGKRRFEKALEQFEHRGEVEVRFRSFELAPDAPAVRERKVYGGEDELTAMAADEGLEYHLDRTQPGNTFDAHRLLQLAADRGVQDQVKERLMRAYLTDGEPISDHEALVRVVAEAGLDADEARTVLGSDAYADAVREDEHLATRIGIQGVPFFVLGRRYGVSGAQPAELMLEALERSWEALTPVE